MTKRKGKPVSFDAMVKFFMHNYNIPTKRDIDRLNDRLDRLEKLIKALPPRNRRTPEKNNGDSPQSATETVLDLIRRSKNGIGIAEVREQTGYDDKKLRNIIFRLNKMEKIMRVSRGSYKAMD
jgi:polyhydroxyalkanoate synthesis regulator phasin